MQEIDLRQFWRQMPTKESAYQAEKNAIKRGTSIEDKAMYDKAAGIISTPECAVINGNVKSIFSKSLRTGPTPLNGCGEPDRE